MKTCRFQELLADEAMGLLGGEEHERLTRHLEQCPGCRRELAACRETLEFVHDAYPHGPAPEGAFQAVMERIEKAEHAQEPTRESRRRGWASPLPFNSPVAALCVALALLVGATAWFYQVHGRAPFTAKPLAIKPVSVSGIVLVSRAGSDVWRPLRQGEALRQGDRILSGAGAAASFAIYQHSVLAQEASSVMQIEEADGSTSLTLERGSLVADLEKGHPPFVIQTPDGAVRALGTKFRISVE